MAAAISVVANGAVSQIIAVSGSGWGVDPVTVRVHGPDSLEAQVDLTPDIGGDIVGFRFVPVRTGVLTVDANDGTDNVVETVKISS